MKMQDALPREPFEIVERFIPLALDGEDDPIYLMATRPHPPRADERTVYLVRFVDDSQGFYTDECLGVTTYPWHWIGAIVMAAGRSSP